MRVTMRTPYSYRKEMLAELTPFDPTRTDYTEQDLAKYADALLRETTSDFEKAERTDFPFVEGKLKTKAPILMQEHIEPRWRKEVKVETGTPDRAITNSLSADNQTMFNRQHPQGRKVNSKAQRKTNGASYYR